MRQKHIQTVAALTVAPAVPEHYACNGGTLHLDGDDAAARDQWRIYTILDTKDRLIRNWSVGDGRSVNSAL